jgi:hypothetical protein
MGRPNTSTLTSKHLTHPLHLTLSAGKAECLHMLERQTANRDFSIHSEHTYLRRHFPRLLLRIISFPLLLLLYLTHFTSNPNTFLCFTDTSRRYFADSPYFLVHLGGFLGCRLRSVHISPNIGYIVELSRCAFKTLPDLTSCRGCSLTANKRIHTRG